jgi:MioC protein
MPTFNKLHILVGTMTGNAEYLAQTIEFECADQVAAIEVTRMDGLGSEVFSSPETLYLVCTSTYGAGDVPDNAMALYASLDDQPRDLSMIRYGVIALGDFGSYPNTFANGGKRFDERLAGLGAQRVGEVYCHDASSGTAPEEEGTAWCKQWLTQVMA